MRRNEHDHYKRVLEAKAAELEQTLGNRRLIAVETAPEECEQTTLSALRDLAVLTLDRNSRLLADVKAALARLSAGDYLICEDCEDAIKPNRLAAIPWARLCVHCQSRMDCGSSPVTSASLPSLFRMAA